MDLFEQVEWINWKKMTDKEKQMIMEQLVMYYVSPELEMANCVLVDFELYGIKCRTFELELNGELYIFIPGNSEAILGWDLGAEGLRPHELLGFDVEGLEKNTFKTTLTNEEIQKALEWVEEEKLVDLTSIEGISEYINKHTTDLRKVKIPAMLVQKYALPAGTEFLGIYDTVTGIFEGEVDQFSCCEEQVGQSLFPQLTAKESLSWSFPETVLEPNKFYLEYLPESNHYFVYSHRTYTLTELQRALKSQGFDLLSEDQWEYAVGAGTRRLFRWGNELLLRNNESSKQIKGKMVGSNMFGLMVDTQKKRYELTKNPEIVKLLQQTKESDSLIEEMLPLATYYRSEHCLAEEHVLDSESYLYRKAIIITP